MIIHDLATVNFLAEKKCDQGRTQLKIKGKIVSNFTHTHTRARQEIENILLVTLTRNRILTMFNELKAKRRHKKVEMYGSGIKQEMKK